MLKKFVMIFGIIVFSTITYGKEVTFRLEEGTLTLGDLLKGCTEISTSKPSKRVGTNTTGKIISIHGIPYEVRYFSFEDTSGKLKPSTTFRDYAESNKLLGLKSASTKPLPGIHFESFDFRRTPLNDGVYFSMAVRKVEKGDG